MATSSFLTNHNALIGTCLQTPGAAEYPDDSVHMYWPPGVTPGWPAGTSKANYDKHVQMWGGRKPQAVRIYNSSPFGTTGVNGSAGAYGTISNEMRLVANDGAVLVMTIKWPNPAGGVYGGTAWATIANNLNAAGDNSYKQQLRVLETNLRRWKADTGNTAPVKKIILGYHHEPDGDGAGADYKAAARAIFTYLARRGIGDANRRINVPLDGPTAPGGAATFIDVIEACMVSVGYNVGTGGNYAFWPGDDICLWFFCDPYNWGGGQHATGTAVGHVAQPGDQAFTRYNDAWNPLRKPIQAQLNWSDYHPDVLLAIAEFGVAEDLDRFALGAKPAGSASDVIGVLTSTKAHTGVPTAKGEWFRQVPRLAQGLASAPGTSAMNTFAAEPRATRIKIWLYWNDQQIIPRWFNTKAHMPGDTFVPSSTGATMTSSFDGFRAMVNDPWFDAIDNNSPNPPPVVNPGSPTVTGIVGATGRDYTFTAKATAGSAALASFSFDYGDGSDVEVITGSATTQTATHTYLTDGVYKVKVTVAAVDGGTSSKTTSFTVVGAVTPPDPNPPNPTDPTEATIEPVTGAPYLPSGYLVQNLRFILNPAIDKLAAYMKDRATRRIVKPISATSYTLTADDAGAVLEFSASSAVTVAVPANATVPFPFGTYVDLVQRGTGQVTVVNSAGVTINTPQTLATRARYSTIRVMQRSALNAWIVSGDLSSGTTTDPTPTDPVVVATNDDLLAKDFNTGPAGASINMVDLTSHYGSDAIYDTNAYEGSFSALFDLNGAASQYRKDFTGGLALAWVAFYVKLDALPTASLYLCEWFGAGVKIGDLRLNTTGTLTVRDGAGAQSVTTTTPLNAGEWARIAVKIVPGSATGHLIRTYQGAAVNSTTPTNTATGTATAAAQTKFDLFRFGSMSAASGAVKFRIDRLRMNSTVEPSPVAN